MQTWPIWIAAWEHVTLRGHYCERAVSTLMFGIRLFVSGVVALAAPLSGRAVRMACGRRRTGSRFRRLR